MDNLYDTLGNLTKRNNDLKAEVSKKKIAHRNKRQ